MIPSGISISGQVLQRKSGKERSGCTSLADREGDNSEKYGGDLEGIRQKLPYLQDLGITGIYLNPVMEAETNHKYDTTDYTKDRPVFRR